MFVVSGHKVVAVLGTDSRVLAACVTFNQLLLLLGWSVICTTWVIMVIVSPKQLVFVSLQVTLPDCATNFGNFSPLLIIQANKQPSGV